MLTQTGTTVRNIGANISSLSASTVYHFRIVAHNSAGTTFSGDRTCTTLRVTGPPVVTTKPATLIASVSAMLNGSVDPHGLTTSVYFQYGTTTSYGLTTVRQSQSGNTYRNVSANISSLRASTFIISESRPPTAAAPGTAATGPLLHLPRLVLQSSQPIRRPT